MNVPSKLNNISLIFKNFYDRKFQNRELNWLYDKGSVVVQTTYLAKAYQLEVTVTQCAVLMALNEKERVTVKELMETIGVDQPTLRKALKTSLCKPKVGVIQNTSGKPNFEDPNEEIYINTKFQSNTFKKNFIPKLTAEQMVKDKSKNSVMGAVDETVAVQR